MNPPEQQRRSTFLVAAIGVIVLVVVALVILKSQGPEDQQADELPVSPSMRLSHSSDLLDAHLSDFDGDHDHWPTSAALSGRTLTLADATHQRRFSPGLDAGVTLTWYRGDGDRFAYCLTRGPRYLLNQTSATRIDKAERKGACPAASLTPTLDPTP